jgi:ABC-type nitrate/sulfonate/bicarbonate transport system substrate-binding protein
MLLAFALTPCLLMAGCSQNREASAPEEPVPLRVAIAPYQDMAMLVNAKELGLEKKYGTKLELLTVPWEELFPTIASAGRTADVGFASLADYLAKTEKLNNQGDDPILYIYPAYVFRGGGFVSFNQAVPEITPQALHDKALLKQFLGFRFGAQKNSSCHMLLWMIARKAGLKLSDLKFVDTTLNDGLLAAEQGSLDGTAVGLTQRTEALKHHGRVVVSMDTVGLVDIAGFICKESVYKKRTRDIEALIRMWCDCTDYVTRDPENHGAATMAYLKANSSTTYTMEELKRAFSQEYFPKSVIDAQQKILSKDGQYSIVRLAPLCNQYLLDIGATKTSRPVPKTISISNQVAGQI